MLYDQPDTCASFNIPQCGIGQITRGCIRLQERPPKNDLCHCITLHQRAVGVFYLVHLFLGTLKDFTRCNLLGLFLYIRVCIFNGVVIYDFQIRLFL